MRAALLSREVLSFLGVGGTGYVVDVVAFNWLRSVAPFATLDPTISRTLAVIAAMVVTYLGNSLITWSGTEPMDRRREIALFVVFNIVGFGFSVVTLAVSHDLFGLTSRLDDNVSANVVGMALGTAFRFWSYRRFVFADPAPEPAIATSSAV
jgi:putative flippase GtrA